MASTASSLRFLVFDQEYMLDLATSHSRAAFPDMPVRSIKLSLIHPFPN